MQTKMTTPKTKTQQGRKMSIKLNAESIAEIVVDKLHKRKDLYVGGLEDGKRFKTFILFIIHTTIKETLNEVRKHKPPHPKEQY